MTNMNEQQAKLGPRRPENLIGGNDWFAAVAKLLHANVSGVLSCLAYEFKCSDPPQLLAQCAEHEAVGRWLETSFPSWPTWLFEAPVFAGSLRAALAHHGWELDARSLGEGFADLGIGDCFRLQAIAPSGHGLAVDLCLARGASAPQADRRWRQIAAHLAADYRAQRRDLAAGVRIEAPRSGLGELDIEVGRIVYGAVGEIEHGYLGDDGLALWRELVLGRCTPVDGFEADPLRYQVFRRNAAPAARKLALAPRELEVVERIARGETTRDTADALGLTETTVRGYLSAGLGKLNLNSRAQLLALRSTLLGSLGG